MIYELLAILVAISHFMVVVILVISPIPVLLGWLIKNPVLERVYLLLTVLTALSFLVYRACFLTLWEQKLLLLANSTRYYTGGFVCNYLKIASIEVSDIVIFRFLVIFATLGLGGTLFHHAKAYLQKRGQRF